MRGTVIVMLGTVVVTRGRGSLVRGTMKTTRGTAMFMWESVSGTVNVMRRIVVAM